MLSRLGLGDFMKKASEINYAKLLGFESIGDLISGDIDFKDEAVAAKLGAKIGIDVQTKLAPKSAMIRIQASRSKRPRNNSSEILR